MIPHSDRPLQTTQWQEELSRAINDPAELFDLLELDRQLLPASMAASNSFALRVPRPFVAKMRKGDLADPLLAQVLPGGPELESVAGYSQDPLAESLTNPVPGLIHKYRGRVLLIGSPVCAVNCRYCFRRHFPYAENQPSKQQWRTALAYIAEHPEISEVILSGGDPLAANDNQLSWLARTLAEIPHLQRLRVHTRLPVVIPSRVTAACVDWLSETRLRAIVVLHINHPNEIDSDLQRAVFKLRQANIDVLNQSVLLKGVNDHATTLATLSEKLFNVGILPYYLHMLDPVAGAAHFAVDRSRTIALQEELLARLPGYLVPRVVKEIPKAASKLPLEVLTTEA